VTRASLQPANRDVLVAQQRFNATAAPKTRIVFDPSYQAIPSRIAATAKTVADAHATIKKATGIELIGARGARVRGT
jgi:hypothetical protein